MSVAEFPDYAKSKPQLKFQLTFEGAWPSAVAFVDGGRRLAAANQAGQIFIWDLEAEADKSFKPSGDRKAPNLVPVRCLVGHENAVSRLAATPDGKTLISASFDRTVRIWDVAASVTAKVKVVLDAETRERDAKRNGGKSTGDAGPTTVEMQTDATVLTGHDDFVSGLSLSRDGRRLVTGDYGARVIVWDVATRKEASRFSGLPWNWIVATAAAPDGKTAVVSEFRYKRDDFDIPAAALRVWDLEAGQSTLDLLKIQFPKYDSQATTYEAAQTWRKFTGDGLIAADVSPDGKLFALGQGGETDTGKVHLFDATTGKLLRDVSGHRYGVTDARFSHDGRYLFSTGRDTTLRICDVANGKEAAALGEARGGQFKDWLSALAISPDGRTLAAADIAGLVHVWTV